MSWYVQNLSARDQEILNHLDFQPVTPRPFGITPAQTTNPSLEPIDPPSIMPGTSSPIRTNSRCLGSSPPGLSDGKLPIRRQDIQVFRDYWIRNTYKNIINPKVLRRDLTVWEWLEAGEGRLAALVMYRTFKLCVCTTFAGAPIEFSMGDIDQILTYCLLESQGEEMPAYFGNSVCDTQAVTWYLFPMSRPELERSIQANKSFISANEKPRYVARYSILAELRRRWDEGEPGVDEVLERLGHLGAQMELVQTEHLQLGNYRAYSLRLLEGLCRMTDVTT